MTAVKDIKWGEFLDQQNKITFSRTTLLHGKNVKYSLYRPGQDLVGPEAENPKFQDGRLMRLESLSILRTYRLYPSCNIPGVHLC
jgi:hypothetical protein